MSRAQVYRAARCADRYEQLGPDLGAERRQLDNSFMEPHPEHADYKESTTACDSNAYSNVEVGLTPKATGGRAFKIIYYLDYKQSCSDFLNAVMKEYGLSEAAGFAIRPSSMSNRQFVRWQLENGSTLEAECRDEHLYSPGMPYMLDPFAVRLSNNAIEVEAKQQANAFWQARQVNESQPRF